ncbi:MAG: hypothetical protein WBK76_01020 [Candidatus Saccharimonadales bacterium]|jgi:hypothetical protein|nr:hypothetical protein [Patescibacteria group bacterium]
MKTKTKRTLLPTKKVLSSEPSALLQTERDLKDAILTVSVFVNLFGLCLWVALQTTARYDAALVDFFIAR